MDTLERDTSVALSLVSCPRCLVSLSLSLFCSSYLWFHFHIDVSFLFFFFFPPTGRLCFVFLSRLAASKRSLAPPSLCLSLVFLNSSFECQFRMFVIPRVSRPISTRSIASRTANKKCHSCFFRFEFLVFKRSRSSSCPKKKRKRCHRVTGPSSVLPRD